MKFREIKPILNMLRVELKGPILEIMKTLQSEIVTSLWLGLSMWLKIIYRSIPYNIIYPIIYGPYNMGAQFGPNVLSFRPKN